MIKKHSQSRQIITVFKVSRTGVGTMSVFLLALITFATLAASQWVTPAYSQEDRSTPSAMMSRQDLSGDGVVTREEWHSRHSFERFDIDKDGRITLSEIEQIKGSRKNRHHSAIPVGKAPGKRFANVRFITKSGAPLDLKSLRGKVLLLIPIASWCPPCIAAVPSYASLDSFYRNHSDVRVLFYNYKDDFSRVKLAVQRNGGKEIDLLDAGVSYVRGTKGWLNTPSGKKFKLRGMMPQYYILDRQGIVLQAMYGRSGTKSSRRMCADIERAVKGLPIQADASQPINYDWQNWSRC